MAGIFGGIAGAGATVRTLVNVNAGGRGRLSGVVHGLCLLLVLLLFGDVAGRIPNVVLAGILLVTAVGMVDRWSRELVWKLTGTAAQKREIATNLAVVLLVTVITVVVDLMIAVGVGIVVASFLFVEKMSRSPIRQCYRGDVWHSRRVLPPETMERLAAEGRSTLVFELRGPLFFGTADKLATETGAELEGVERMIMDFRRVTEVDSTGARVLLLLEEQLQDRGIQLAFSSIDPGHFSFLKDMGVVGVVGEGRFFPDADRALEWAEDQILVRIRREEVERGEQPLEQLEVFRGVDPAILHGYLTRETFEAGDLVMRQGEPGDSLYVLAAGSMSVKLQLDAGKDRRLATFGPGSVVGEQALLEERPRLADVRADQPSIAYRLTQQNLHTLIEEHPAVASRFLWNIGVELSARLRGAHAELASLEQ
ncbi:MAG: SLC26A/SulP transporter family protein [Armatimonadetes bacterium]|nr:SLC26A/SulP transporter family protein [Armatimonadota bacterium]